jgi:uncharacterized protein
LNFLLDANVILDKALVRARHAEVDQLFAKLTGDQICVSRFSLHAIAWYMTPRAPETFRKLCMDLSLAGVLVVDLALDELSRALDAMTAFKLDFDDAFNVAIAEKHSLTIISFDTDFDRTLRGRKTPAQVLSELSPSAE